MINLESNKGRVGHIVLNSLLISLKSLLNCGDRSIDERRKTFLCRFEGKLNADSFLMTRELSAVLQWNTESLSYLCSGVDNLQRVCGR